MEERAHCIRCLLREIDGEEEYRKLEEYLASYPEESKVPEKIYEERLRLCKACECLNQGICRKCGCFVEARALKKIGTCPHEKPRW
ncbi:MAG: hypothetical protein IJ733_06400 [Lachnospiraceae bacterium]|nr:hypothetical protein [Lachnospiraceae bacterium]